VVASHRIDKDAKKKGVKKTGGFQPYLGKKISERKKERYFNPTT